MNLATMRDEYTRSGLNKEELLEHPMAQFELWFKQAMEAEVFEPNAMSLATVNAEGQPSQRTVLLKYFDERGLVFFTNYESRKARDIEQNGLVSLLFPWLALERQVRIEGRAHKITAAESLKYFMSRPRGSQIGAWVSQQSTVITSRQLLQSKFEELKNKFTNKEVPLPSFWGGYRIAPTHFEYWQGRQHRLHDRFVYKQKGTNWQIERLAP
ncbi:MAG: pyridoxamine 5'-phosphate oxidase [Chitinophagales bacterium]|nr:pyridoxamine 5'-phosphate oxidase [Chitinophagales bacterium]